MTDLAISYVGRFATSQQKLSRYLQRKITERGWDAPAPADVDAIVAAMVGYGYVNDAAYAEMQARSLSRRGYGRKRVDAAVRAAGIDEADSAAALGLSDAARMASALRLAQRRRWGPYAAQQEDDRAKREKMIGAFLRAGHDVATARAILAMEPGADVSMMEATARSAADE
ncbi:MAG: regulatory protein RecX [Sphingopyxis sp.]